MAKWVGQIGHFTTKEANSTLIDVSCLVFDKGFYVSTLSLMHAGVR